MGSPPQKSNKEWYTRLFNKRWEFTLPQFIGLVFTWVIICALLTVLWVRWALSEPDRELVIDTVHPISTDESMIFQNIELASNGTIYVGDAAEAELRRLITGKLLYRVPLEMVVGESKVITVRVAKNISEEFTAGFDDPSEVKIRDLKISPLMSANLFSEDEGAFEIKQRFPSGAENNQLVAGDSPTEWVWEIHPLKAGSYKVNLVANVTLVIPDYGEKAKSFQIFSERINVRVSPIYYAKVFIKSNWQWVVNTIIGSGLIGLIVAIVKRRKKKKTRSTSKRKNRKAQRQS